MATTGLLLCLFLLFHLINNLALFAGPDVFNQIVISLEAVKPLIRVMEAGLALLFFIHIVNGIRLTIENKRAGSVPYSENEVNENSSFFSRYMFVTGSVIFIFLVTHLSTFWYQFQVIHDHDAYFQIVTANTSIGFGNPLITLLYAIAMILLAFHLRHGFQSAFQTFGIRYNKYSKLIEWVGVLFWFFIPLGFFFITIYFGLMKGGI